MRPNVIVTSESFIEDDGHFMSTLLTKGWLDTDGYKVRLLGEDNVPQWTIRGRQYAPKEIALTTVMADSDVDEITVAKWYYENVDSLIYLSSAASPSLLSEVYITLKDPVYSAYSSEEIMVTASISILVI